MVIGTVEAPPLRGTVADMLDVKGRQVHAIGPKQTVYDAISMMDARRCGALLVMDGDVLVGILSERDYTRRVILQGRASRDTRAEEIMTRGVITVDSSMNLAQCLRLVTERGIRHLPVVDGGRVTGVLSIGDLVRAVVAQQAETINSLQSYIGSDYPT